MHTFIYIYIYMYIYIYIHVHEDRIMYVNICTHDACRCTCAEVTARRCESTHQQTCKSLLQQSHKRLHPGCNTQPSVLALGPCQPNPLVPRNLVLALRPLADCVPCLGLTGARWVWSAGMGGPAGGNPGARTALGPASQAAAPTPQRRHPVLTASNFAKHPSCRAPATAQIVCQTLSLPNQGKQTDRVFQLYCLSRLKAFWIQQHSVVAKYKTPANQRGFGRLIAGHMHVNCT